MPDGNSVILDKDRSRNWRLARFVRAAGNLLMGTRINLKHASCFKHPTLFGSDSRDVPLKSKTFKEIILPITFPGIFVTLFWSINNEQISEALNDSGSELNLF
jgi:hypothetical protein